MTGCGRCGKEVALSSRHEGVCVNYIATLLITQLLRIFRFHISYLHRHERVKLFRFF